MNPLRSLRNRLALVFGLIVLGAIATVYLTTTPRLEDRLTQQKLDGLEADAKGAAPALAEAVASGQEGETMAGRVARAASRSSAEVLVLKPLEGKPTGLTLAEDSTVNGGVESGEVSRLALTAFESGKPQMTTITPHAGSAMAMSVCDRPCGMPSRAMTKETNSPPTSSRVNIAEVRTVLSKAVHSMRQDSCRRSAVMAMAPAAPTAEASVGVAMPPYIEPSTAVMRNIDGA